MRERRNFSSLNATMLLCPKCKVAQPVRERLLLVLPEGNLYDYLCIACGTSVGSKTEKKRRDISIYPTSNIPLNITNKEG